MFTTLVLLASLQGREDVATSQPPADAAVLRVLPAPRGIPYVLEVFRDDMVIVKEPGVETRVTLRLPLGARVSLAVERWNCSVFYTETLESTYPLPLTVIKKRAQVVYIDRLK